MHGPIVWRPSAEYLDASNLTAYLRQHRLASYEALLSRAEAEPEWWWRTVADRVAFYKPYERILDLSEGPAFARWCVGGTTNIVLNALDRHRGTDVWEQPCFVHEAESGAATTWTYADLDAEVCRVAGALRRLGIGKGEVVAIYLPNVGEAVAGMLAIAKIGAVAMPLFSGFGAEALKTRLVDSGAVALLTIDGTLRRARPSPMLEMAQAAAEAAPNLKHIVCLVTGVVPSTLKAGRDHDWKALTASEPATAPTLEVDAEDPCLLVYTSGTSGKPKGTVHAHAGFTAKLALDLGLLMDLKPSDRMLWMSDMGWLVGPILSFGATILGASFVLAEGAPDYPAPARMWQLVEKHKISFLGIAPTTIRSFMHRAGTGGCDLSTLRVIVSTGEAWTPDAWTWAFEHVSERRVPIINYTGGTEIGGGIVSGTVIHPMKPCAFAGPIPGMGADITDAAGNSLPPNTVGELVLRRPSIGQTRGLWHDNERYLDSYWREIPGVWRHGDWAMRDDDGYWYILGRSDDTLKIAGKRTGPSEIEALLTATGKVAEAAAIGVKDALKGEAVGCIVVPRHDVKFDEGTRAALSDAVVAGLGYPFK
ncbi:MAG: AMP-binding protein, partial [Proteobacteria bacterium]|nr:AMP-binding protein [Pseudomonadota bacterium]